MNINRAVIPEFSADSAAEPMDAQDDDAVWELTLDEDNSDDAK